jgi:hypothetical protein
MNGRERRGAQLVLGEGGRHVDAVTACAMRTRRVAGGKRPAHRGVRTFFFREFQHASRATRCRSVCRRVTRSEESGDPAKQPVLNKSEKGSRNL